MARMFPLMYDYIWNFSWLTIKNKPAPSERILSKKKEKPNASEMSSLPGAFLPKHLLAPVSGKLMNNIIPE